MILEDGEYYLNASREIVKIDKTENGKNFKDQSYNFYTSNGISFSQFNHFDLIAHIPKQLLNHLVVEVNNYHTDNEFKQMIDNVYGETK